MVTKFDSYLPTCTTRLHYFKLALIVIATVVVVVVVVCGGYGDGGVVA